MEESRDQARAMWKGGQSRLKNFFSTGFARDIRTPFVSAAFDTNVFPQWDCILLACMQVQAFSCQKAQP
jgi:hypothetical protein